MPFDDLVDDDTTRSFVIDCATCTLRHSSACDDCLVTFFCGPETMAGSVVVDLAEARALRNLGDAGLTPPLRHRIAR